jgi:hypothetical protein
MRVVRVHAGEEPAYLNAVQDKDNPNHAGLRVGGGIAAQDGAETFLLTLYPPLTKLAKPPKWRFWRFCHHPPPGGFSNSRGGIYPL